jgi:hypothetical protein
VVPSRDVGSPVYASCRGKASFLGFTFFSTTHRTVRITLWGTRASGIFAPAMVHRAGVRAAAPGCQCLGGSVLTPNPILDAPDLITPYRFDCVIGTVDLRMCGED